MGYDGLMGCCSIRDANTKVLFPVGANKKSG